MSKKLLLASTSTLYGETFLEYLLPALKTHFKGVTQLLFIPYARPGGITHKAYTELVSSAFSKTNIAVQALHEFDDPVQTVTEAQAIYTGGGNTFVLLNQLYKNKLIEPLKESLQKGTPYLGTSAGSNICGVSIQTTNDMPIQYPPTFEALGMVPFNINPHYLDLNRNSTHMGESRATRIVEYHQYNATPVIGLREGSWISVNEDQIVLKGNHTARIFQFDQEAYEIETERNLPF